MHNTQFYTHWHKSYNFKMPQCGKNTKMLSLEHEQTQLAQSVPFCEDGASNAS